LRGQSFRSPLLASIAGLEGQRKNS
jgi:hypothetical protein